MPNDVDEVPRITVIGNPDSRRVIGFSDTARRLGWTVDVVSYLDIIQDRVLSPESGYVRLESPGESAEIARAILTAGIAPMEAAGRIPIRVAQIRELQCDRGEILHPLQWFLGYRRILESLKSRWDHPNLRWMSTPGSVVRSFDKIACLERWSSAGLPVSYRYPTASTYSEIRQTVPDRHARLFVKLRYGYCAIGAVALEWRGSLVRAITTVEVTWSDGRPRLFVSKKPRILTREFEIAWLIDTLAMEEILVEDWLPKARWNGCPFDLRVITIGGIVHHVVGRANPSPFTNLNLDAKRISRDDVVERLGDGWWTMESICQNAAEALPDAGMLGIDLLVRPGDRKFALLEANAFGDYLPGLTYQGMSTWEAQIHQLSNEPIPKAGL
jgi:hypothetical protein